MHGESFSNPFDVAQIFNNYFANVAATGYKK